jgi:hypothetical protein
MKSRKAIALLFLLVAACKSPEPKTEENTSIEVPKTESSLSDLKLANIIEAIPSPLELSTLIQYSGAQYNATVLNNPDYVSRYNSQFSKAINLGIYGADLGYINIYHKTYSAIEYLNIVYGLASDLQIGAYFDFNTLKRLAKNNERLDSVVYITTKGFERMHKQLKKTKNSHISTLMIAGGWIEEMYIATGIINSAPAKYKELISTVFEEQLILDDILSLLNSYNKNPNFEKLIADFTHLKKVFAGISEDNAKSHTSLTLEQFAIVTKEVQKLRTTLTD